MFFTTLAESLTVVQNEPGSFSTDGVDVPEGYHSYQLVATVTNPVRNVADAVGPVTFTRISLQ